MDNVHVAVHIETQNIRHLKKVFIKFLFDFTKIGCDRRVYRKEKKYVNVGSANVFAIICIQ